VRTIATRPSGEDPVTGEGGVRVRPTRSTSTTSLVLACVMLGSVFAAGVVLAIAPGQNAVDTWGFSLLPGVVHSGFLDVVTDLGLAPVAGGVALLVGALTWRRDRARAVACLGGPVLAVALTEVLKVTVGRRYEDALCYPSGTTAAVTAVVAVIVLVTRGTARASAVAVGAVLVVFEAVAVVKLRWHYPSDALAGIVLGAGSSTWVDAVLHRRRHRRSP
jgi:membrane-associated phospholipid phosphatase